MRRTKRGLLGAVLALMMLVTMLAPAASAAETAIVKLSAIRVDGKETQIEGYLIDNECYLKIRDVAYALSGSDLQFDVTYNASAQAVELLPGTAYTPIGGEYAATSGDNCSKSLWSFVISGKETTVDAYVIGGYNFCKAGDLASAIGFQTGSVEGGISISTEPVSYSLDAADYASSWELIPKESFELVAKSAAGPGGGPSEPVATGIYNAAGVYALEDVVYVSNPTISGGKPVQQMNIYIPEEYMRQEDDGTYSIDPSGSKTVTYYDETGKETGTYTWNAETAPIVLVNTVNGYAGSSRFSITDSRAWTFYIDYLANGFILVGVDSRGIGGFMGKTTTDDDGIIVGKAPSGLVDLKAAVAFLKYNDDVLAGDSEKIFSLGMSAGGAMSALMGATGDGPEYVPYLEELGAADASNSIYGSQVYCPITDLDNGDAAYEWLHRYQTSYTGWGGEATNFDDYELALQGVLVEIYVDYIQGLGLDLGDDGASGAYYTALGQKAVDALNHAVTTGQYQGGPITPDEVISTIASEGSTLLAYLEENGLALEDVISWNEAENTFELVGFEVFDMGGTFGRAKGVLAIGGAGSMEAGLFGPNGTTEEETVFFSATHLAALERLMQSDDAEIAAKAAAEYEACAEEIRTVIDSGVTHMMNPMYYMTGEGTSTMAKYWRFNNGTNDPDLGSIAAWTMYNQLRSMGGYVTEFNLIYGAQHTLADYLSGEGAYYTANSLMTWIAQAAAGEAVSD